MLFRKECGFKSRLRHKTKKEEVLGPLLFLFAEVGARASQVLSHNSRSLAVSNY